MAGPKIVKEGATVVVRGVFNAAIFSPHWFRDQELIGDLEMHDAEIDVISRNISVFQMSWLRCQVTEDGLQLSTENVEEFERLRDAVIGVLHTLQHTPVAVLGINRDFHVQMDSYDDLNRIGDAITPKNIWDGLLHFPAMRSVTMFGARSDRLAGQVTVQVEPSMRVENGLFVNHNDHYNLTYNSDPPTSREDAYDLRTQVESTPEKSAMAARTLKENWVESMKSADAILAAVLKMGSGTA